MYSGGSGVSNKTGTLTCEKGPPERALGVTRRAAEAPELTPPDLEDLPGHLADRHIQRRDRLTVEPNASLLDLITGLAG